MLPKVGYYENRDTPLDVVTGDHDANRYWGAGMRDQVRGDQKEFSFSVVGRDMCSAIETGFSFYTQSED